MTTPAISVIVPTTARAARAPLLLRALESIVGQAAVRAQPIVVANGVAQDADLVARLRATAGLHVVFRPEPGLRGALEAGLALVDTEFVATLDDDDLLLPGALALRRDALAADPTLDVVVTNGLRRHAGRDTVHVASAADVRRDPLRALFAHNWLLPGSWLARTSAVSPWLYDKMPSYLECTYLALRFAGELRMTFLDEPTVVWHTDTQDAESRSLAYQQGQPAALARLLDLPLSPDVRERVRDRIRLAWHGLADWSLAAGRVDDAFRYHLRTVQSPGGWRHLPFARHLLAAWWSGGR